MNRTTPWNSSKWSGPPEGRYGPHSLDAEELEGLGDELAESLDDRRIVFAMEHGRHVPVTRAAKLALKHYGFAPPLDDASYGAFETILGENWNVLVDWYRTPEEPYEQEMERLADGLSTRREYEAEERYERLQERLYEDGSVF